MEMIEQSQQIYGLTPIHGYLDLFALMEIKNAIISHHLEVVELELKVEVVVMIEVRFLKIYALIF